MTQYEKMVYLPIVVPRGDHCWGGPPNYVVCGHFDNEGGHPKCELNLDVGGLEYTPEGTVLKPPRCYELEQFKDIVG